MAVLPCSDSTVVKEVRKVENIKVSLEAYTGEPVEDECTPFCFCSCCNLLQILAYSEIEIVINKPFFITFYQQPLGREMTFTSDYLDRIWLPPKIESFIS